METGVASTATADGEWLLLLLQFPAAPSSARVALWRRLRAIGATGVLNGAWALPAREAHAAIFAGLAQSARESGGSAAIFTARAANAAEHDALVARFRADRARDYTEFADRAGAFLAEVAREMRLQKFTFAELEEIEDDLEKLSTWLGRIRARDFFPDERLREATATLDSCGAALRAFAAAVYAREGIAADVTRERAEEPGSGIAGAQDGGDA